VRPSSVVIFRGFVRLLPDGNEAVKRTRTKINK
jgi:hypothetical protein